MIDCGFSQCCMLGLYHFIGLNASWAVFISIVISYGRHYVGVAFNAILTDILTAVHRLWLVCMGMGINSVCWHFTPYFLDILVNHYVAQLWLHLYLGMSCIWMENDHSSGKFTFLCVNCWENGHILKMVCWQGSDPQPHKHKPNTNEWVPHDKHVLEYHKWCITYAYPPKLMYKHGILLRRCCFIKKCFWPIMMEHRF